MAPDINIAHAGFALLGTEGPSAQCEKLLDHRKNWIFENLKYDYHNVITGKDTPYLNCFAPKNILGPLTVLLR